MQTISEGFPQQVFPLFGTEQPEPLLIDKQDSVLSGDRTASGKTDSSRR